MRGSKHRGHEILPMGVRWVYGDTGGLVSDDPERDCGFCNLQQTPEGHDGCLGVLPGVMNACCGHGDDSTAYVQSFDGTCVRGEKAKELFGNVRKL